MSVQRSPPGSGFNVTRCGSDPNLAIKNKPSEATGTSQITIRNKRKLANENEELKAELSDMAKEFTEMRKQMTAMQTQMSEIMASLSSNNAMQINNFTKISEDISVIKSQVTEIKLTTVNLTEEQNKLKLDVSSIKNFNTTTQEKIKSLESKLQQINSTTTCQETTPSMKAEEIITELNERCERSKNLLVSGISEPTSKDPKERQEHDRTMVWNILKSIDPDCVEPKKVFRLGKYNPNKKRPIKACFESQNITKYILRHKSNVKNSEVKIFGDQTPQQQAYMKTLTEELDHRTKNGEINLRIKYIKGIPKIISAPSKNSTSKI